jgi:hypothetical protein
VRRLAVAILVATAACSSGQDPGLTPSTDAGPTTTSHTLSPCPPGGPDATTPAAGCLAEDGTVIRP